MEEVRLVVVEGEAVARHHLIEDDAQTPEISLVPIIPLRAIVVDFRSRVSRRSNEGMAEGSALAATRQSEIDEHNTT